MHIKYLQNCRSCGNDKFGHVLSMGDQYIQGCFDIPGQTNKLPLRKIPVNLVRCLQNKGGCGLVQLDTTIDGDILYSSYFYRSSINDLMRRHLRDIADKIVAFADKESISVLDIAANDCYFLKCFPENYDCTGIDPNNIILEAEKSSNIKAINAFFPSDFLLGKKFDVITNIAQFYDNESPLEFLQSVVKLLALDGTFVMELAYLPEMLTKLTYDTILSEHLCYYSFESLNWLFERVGLKSIYYNINDINGGSIQIWLQHKNCNKYEIPSHHQALINLKINEFNLALDRQETYDNFKSNAILHAKSLKKLVEDLVKSGKSIHFYGMSTKLNALLEFAKIGPNLIPFASERTAQKVGGKTLSGIQMISEEESRKMLPDYYFVGPYWSKEVIFEREKEFLKRGGKFILPLPKIEIYPN